MKNFLIYLAVSIVLGCSKKPSDTPISAEVEKIIITDGPEFKGILYVIAFTNNNNKDIKLFSNSFLENKEYIESGFLMNGKDFSTPIGAMISNQNYIRLPSRSTTKYLFAYSNIYYNKWKELEKEDIKGQLTKLAKSVEIIYNYQTPTYLDERDTIYNRKIIVSKKNIQMDYKPIITIEQALKIVNDK